MLRMRISARPGRFGPDRFEEPVAGERTVRVVFPVVFERIVQLLVGEFEIAEEHSEVFHHIFPEHTARNRQKTAAGDVDPDDVDFSVPERVSRGS